MHEYAHQIRDIIGATFSIPGVKIITSIAIWILHFLFDGIDTIALTALFFLIIGDAFTGVGASWKEGKPIQSRRLIKTAFKIVVYYGMVSASLLTEHAGVSFLPIKETVLGFLAVTEFISILENITRMGYATPNGLVARLVRFRDGR